MAALGFEHGALSGFCIVFGIECIALYLFSMWD